MPPNGISYYCVAWLQAQYNHFAVWCSPSALSRCQCDKCLAPLVAETWREDRWYAIDKSFNNPSSGSDWDIDKEAEKRGNMTRTKASQANEWLPRSTSLLSISSKPASKEIQQRGRLLYMLSALPTCSPMLVNAHIAEPSMINCNPTPKMGYHTGLMMKP